MKYLSCCTDHLSSRYCPTGLSSIARGMIEYIEELLNDPSELAEFHAATGGFPYALDESISDSSFSIQDVIALSDKGDLQYDAVRYAVAVYTNWVMMYA